MKILVLGSGLLGVTTAYELGKRGMDVTVLDRQGMSGMETSYANGGQLSYSHAEPWANPSSLKKLPKWLLDRDAPLVFRLRADMRMIRWGLAFLRNCTQHRASVNGINLLRLGLYSKEKLTEIRRDTGIEFDFSDKGVLHIFSTQDAFDQAKRQHEFQGKFGGVDRILTREQCLLLEPSLNYTSRQIIGGIHAYGDESGDAHTYCNTLAKIATERYGVKFIHNIVIDELFTESGRIAGVATNQGDLMADGYVMAMGSYSPIYLRDIGIRVPIYPMKGYSLTLPANEFCPRVSVTDGSYKIVYSRLGNRLRVAGTAEFAGYNTNINEKRIRPILRAASELFPKANWQSEIARWACLRPSTPDGPPILGRTPYPNLFLNTGHGTLGWTQAAGSAAIVADIIENKIPHLLLHGLTYDRYAA